MPLKNPGQAFVAAVTLVAATACAGATSMLDARSEAAASIATLWWFMLGVAAVVFAAVLAAFLPTLRARPRLLDASKHGTWLRVTVVASGVILTSVFIATERTLGGLHALRSHGDLVIQVTGWQWWWEVKYILPGLRDTVVSANEIHIPVGRRVRVEATTGDVIHSLWVPNLGGKVDLVPGRTHSLVLHAERSGLSHGPCAEYCGVQHAHMTLLVNAREPADFDNWLARERLAGAAPSDSQQRAGAAAFVRASCDYCHMIRGTNSLGKLGPDLTHFASRRSIGAGTLEHTPQHLAAWLANPQRIKPGTRMPAVPLNPSDVSALVAYLGALR